MAFCDGLYFERIGAIQQSMHKREKRRLELERVLFAYSRSDKRISQLKCAKLHGHLKEICERERQAKVRNLELLRDVERIETNMKDQHHDHSSLHQHKLEFFNRISKCTALRKKKEQQSDEENKAAFLHTHEQGESLSRLAKDLYNPATVFMGRQTSGVSAAEDATTSVHSCQALHPSPNRRLRSSERPPSGLLKDSKVSGEATAGSRAHLSDDISGSNDSPDGCHLSDKHERMTAAVASVCAFTAGTSVPCGADQQPLSPPATLTRPLKNSPSPSGAGPECERNSSAEYSHSREAAHHNVITEQGEKGLLKSTHGPDFRKESQDEPERSVSVSISSSSVELSVTSGSDLSISLTESELAEVSEGGPHHPDVPPTRRTEGSSGLPEKSSLPVESEHHSTSLHSLESLHTADRKTRPQSSSGSTSLETSSGRLSQEGLFHLLESIEGRLRGEQTNIYSVSTLGERKRNMLISLCNTRAAGVNGEDLEACGAVVLHQLQRLSCSTSKGCLLPEEIVRAHGSNAEPWHISSSLPNDAAPLWDRWFKHALLLKDQRVLSTERLVQLFTPVLLPHHASYSQKAKVLLRTLLSRSSEDEEGPTEKSGSSSCGLPSLLDDSGKARTLGPAQEHRNADRMQGVQSGEEDSQDESPVESIPIRETKAYQLLKQSATQEKLKSSGGEEEEDEEGGLSGRNDGHEEDRGRAERSSHQDPYPWKGKINQKIPAVQSKAFWGESDDSNSEIEAALRPQPFDTNNDDSEDFYD
ncbi:centrosomal protein kizuna [Osmerus mordax]|uniref:centrosomal protein kizuna n=1 Tax=Osmerus mordax TaxID=8014 RepID=UPI003510902F